MGSKKKEFINYKMYLFFFFILIFYNFLVEKKFFFYIYIKYTKNLINKFKLIIYLYMKVNIFKIKFLPSYINILNWKMLIEFAKKYFIKYFCYIRYVYFSLFIHFICFLCNNYYMNFFFYNSEFYFYYFLKIKYCLFFSINIDLLKDYTFFLNEFFLNNFF